MSYTYKINYLKASLLVGESMIIAQQLQSGLDSLDVQKLVLKNNLLGTKSLITTKDYCGIILARFKLMSADFICLIASSSREIVTQALFCATIKYSPLVGDFLHFKVRERINAFYEDIPYSCWDEYIDECRTRDPKMGQLAESSYKKLRSQTYKMLIDAGFISDTKTKLIKKPSFSPNLINQLYKDKEEYILSCLGKMIW
jgi:hypothetical protein